jgi:hypothetical protein
MIVLYLSVCDHIFERERSGVSASNIEYLYAVRDNLARHLRRA